MAACRRLYKHMKARPNVEYDLCVWCCVTHQINLAIKAAVRGSDPNGAMEANCVRMFKYLEGPGSAAHRRLRTNCSGWDGPFGPEGPFGPRRLLPALAVCA